uniref:BTB domain-containing protein n=1 Tax=Leptocylindrus danicus TaxID=163516 RepID=A0A7S2L7C8_9STRA|mmetsp:Transcript_32859/g.47555  ORF Transcript_32859/g.47555 Transcript_32859/m.47555 type:complete len:612 (+) Transcript_32859:126-1961(+)
MNSNNNSGGSDESSSTTSETKKTTSPRPRQCLTWTRITPNNNNNNTSNIPHPRSGAASVIVKKKLYMFGGYGGGTGRLDDFHSFDFETQVWERVPVRSEIRPGRRENNGVVIGEPPSSRVYLFGGYNGTSWLNDLWCFDIDSQRWECIQESAEHETDLNIHTAANNNGGAHLNNNNEQISDAAAGANVLNHANNIVVPNDVHHRDDFVVDANANYNERPSRRFGYVSVVHEGKFVLFGGFDGAKWLNDMYEFDFKTKLWRQIEAKGDLPSVRSCPAWASDEKHVYIQGGYDGVDRKADFFACDLSTYTWKEMPCLGSPPSPRYFHSCCLYANRMYVFGGYSGSERLSDMFVYDFDTNHWSEIDCSNGDAPSGRSSLVAQVYGNCMYIFGGYNGSVVLNDFYKFRLKAIAVPPPLLVHDLRRLINHAEFSDVVFLVEGKEVYASRAILAVRSEYFRVMLYSGGMRESEDTSSPIHLEDISYDVFLKVLEYLYTDSVSDVADIASVGIPLMILSERFMLDRLKSLCEDRIRREITVSNVTEILIASHRHSAFDLKDLALEFILNHLEDPAIVAGLSELKVEPDLLVEIIKCSTMPSSGSSSNRAEHPFGRSFR